MNQLCIHAFYLVLLLSIQLYLYVVNSMIVDVHTDRRLILFLQVRHNELKALNSFSKQYKESFGIILDKVPLQINTIDSNSLTWFNTYFILTRTIPIEKEWKTLSFVFANSQWLNNFLILMYREPRYLDLIKTIQYKYINM